MSHLAAIRIGKSKRVHRLRWEGAELRRGQHVLVETLRGTEIATLVEEPRLAGQRRLPRPGDQDAWSRLDADAFWAALSGVAAEKRARAAADDEKDVEVVASAVAMGDEIVADGEADTANDEVRFLRPASAEDIARQNELLERDEPEEFAFFREKIEELALPMKPVQVEHVHGGERILFYFTSDDRVDFRELVRLLATRFRPRIELRRIPPREAAAMSGGIGICGRELCCSTHLKVLKPVTLKMAKVQGRPVTHDANLGACGRLRCCLRYELDDYEREEGAGCTGCATRG
jgi:cell fate regulator YaaT (PSP1 superfamily)